MKEEKLCKFFIPYPVTENQGFIKWKITKNLINLELTFTEWMMIFYDKNVCIEGLLIYIPKDYVINNDMKLIYALGFSGWWLYYG